MTPRQVSDSVLRTLQDHRGPSAETTALLSARDSDNTSMAPVLPISVSGRSPPRTTSWSVHNGLLRDVEAQSVAGSSDGSLKLNNNNEVRSADDFAAYQITVFLSTSLMIKHSNILCKSCNISLADSRCLR